MGHLETLPVAQSFATPAIPPVSSSSFHAGLTIDTQRGCAAAEAVSPWNPRSHHEVAAALAAVLVAALALAAWSTAMAAGTLCPALVQAQGAFSLLVQTCGSLQIPMHQPRSWFRSCAALEV